MVVKIEVSNLSHIGGKGPGNYSYPKGTTLRGYIKVVNTGSKTIPARAVVYDEENKEEIWVSKGVDLHPGEAIEGEFTVTVDKKRKIIMKAQYFTGAWPIGLGSWQTSDTFGPWYLIPYEFTTSPPPGVSPPSEVPSPGQPAQPQPSQPSVPPGLGLIIIGLVALALYRLAKRGKIFMR